MGWGLIFAFWHDSAPANLSMHLTDGFPLLVSYRMLASFFSTSLWPFTHVLQVVNLRLAVFITHSLAVQSCRYRRTPYPLITAAVSPIMAELAGAADRKRKSGEAAPAQKLSLIHI